MNHIYRIVWSTACNAWLAVAESAPGRGKGSGRKRAATVLLLATGLAQAAPVGGQVSSGAASIVQSGATTTITQSGQNLSLNWQSFNVGSNETVNFVQPSASAIAVNRIDDTRGSQILGQLNANGQVYLVNPNGILFGAGAQLNVGALVASTLELGDASLAGSARAFSGSGAGSVVNQGTINAARGGYVALLGHTVSNQGTISAPLGTVALGAGSAVTLNFNGNSLVSMQVEQSLLNSLADNGGLVRADGGQVLLSAGARDSVLASVVNNTGVIEARTVENHAGTIILLGGMAAGTVNVGGTLDAGAPGGGNGGFVETSAAHVKIAGDVHIGTQAAAGQAGNWLIDPLDFTVAASGGDVTGALLGSLLSGNNVTIQTSAGSNSAGSLFASTGSNGDIFVNDAVGWSANTTLTLNAWRNISINQRISASGASGALVLLYGQGALALNNTASYSVNAPVTLHAGSNFSTRLGSDGSAKNYTVITDLGAAGSTTATDLQGINGNLNANYVLGSDIDASATSGWNSGAGFSPVSNGGSFAGNFDGLGHTITGLYIRSTVNNIGLFGATGSTASIRNVGLVGGSVSSTGYIIGSLVGLNAGAIGNSYATGSASGRGLVGGLVGINNGGSVDSSHATGDVYGTDGSIGGLVGQNAFNTFASTSDISNSYATGNVSGSYTVGGLIGDNLLGWVSNSSASGNVTVTQTGTGQKFGGLLGYNTGTVERSHATGSVTGGEDVGGLAGFNFGGLVTTSYATGSVLGFKAIGGLVGLNQANTSTLHNSSITNSYASGSVVGTGNNVGGLVGSNLGGSGAVNGGSSASVTNSYATASVSGGDYVGGLVGLNTGGQGGNNATLAGGTASIANTYATGMVTGHGFTGGLVGSSANGATRSGRFAPGGAGGVASVGTSFWNTDSSGRASSAGGTGLSSAAMLQMASFASWNTATPNTIANTGGSGAVWRIYEGQTAPLLASFMGNLALADRVVTDNGAAQTGNSSVLAGVFGTAATGTAVGSYHNALYSGQQGYNISGGMLTIVAAVPVPTPVPDPAPVAAPVVLIPGAVPEQVAQLATQLAVAVLLPQTPVGPGARGASTSSTVTQSGTSSAALSGDAAAAPSDSAGVATVRMAPNAGGPLLQIVDGGMRLPPGVLDTNE